MGNLALKKPVRASPLFDGNKKATNANDGDIAGVIQHYASQSSVEDPFWRVDLLDSYVVTTVEIVLRIDADFDLNDVMEVRVGKAHFLSTARSVSLRMEVKFKLPLLREQGFFELVLLLPNGCCVWLLHQSK